MNLDDVIDVGGFFSKDDGDRHVIIANRDGGVQELFWKKPDRS